MCCVMGLPRYGIMENQVSYTLSSLLTLYTQEGVKYKSWLTAQIRHQLYPLI